MKLHEFKNTNWLTVSNERFVCHLLLDTLLAWTLHVM